MLGPRSEGVGPLIAPRSSIEAMRLQSTRALHTLLPADATTAYEVSETRTGKGISRGAVGLGDLTGDDVTFDCKYSPDSPLRSSSASHSLTFSASTSVCNSISQPKDYRSSFFASDKKSYDEKEITLSSSPSRLNTVYRAGAPYGLSPSSLASDKVYDPYATDSPSASASNSPSISRTRRAHTSAALETSGPRSLPATFEDLYVQGMMDKETFQDENPFSNRRRLENSIKSAVRTIGGSKSVGSIRAVSSHQSDGHVSAAGPTDDSLNLSTGSRSGPGSGSGPGPGSRYLLPSNKAGPWTQQSRAAKVPSPQKPERENEEEHSVLNESSQTQFWMLSDSDSGDELDCTYHDAEGTCLFDDSG